MNSFDPYRIRAEFPILQQQINGKPLVYLDNAATSQNPLCVLNASKNYYESYNSNIHRGAHKLARLATEAHEAARETVANHLNAAKTEEVIFTSGATEGINLVADILAASGNIKKGDNVVISAMEHHSNIVPWQMLCQQTGASLRILPIFDHGELDESQWNTLIDENTAVLACTHISNALGVINPMKPLIKKAKQCGALTLIDGAQSAPHLRIDVQALGCDFFVFSGHKTYAPTGIGVLWGKKEVLESLPPWKGGGEMIKQVTFEHTTYNDLPFKYEAGTPNIEGAIALAAALKWMQQQGIESIAKHERSLLDYTMPQLLDLDGFQLYGDAQEKAGVISFCLKGVHHYDLGTLIDQMGVATRTGHHCCQPLMQRFGITGTTRASFAAYNTKEDCDVLITALKKALMMLR